ncbi:MAG: hypothetical protein EPO62_07380 [Candidatus Nitrosotenuis sp.]|nr:MAG: hypothetical protein EPO62_07380 [Candidatus Nitrosotenuis sp.]
MQHADKAKIGVVVGICLIVLVASLVWLPFMNSDSAVQKASHNSIKKMEESEEKLLGFTVHEKAELESKIGGKISLP